MVETMVRIIWKYFERKRLEVNQEAVQIEIDRRLEEQRLKHDEEDRRVAADVTIVEEEEHQRALCYERANINAIERRKVVGHGSKYIDIWP